MGKNTFSGISLEDIMKDIDQNIIEENKARKKNFRTKIVKRFKISILTIFTVSIICFVTIYFVRIFNTTDKEVTNNNNYAQETYEDTSSNSIPKHLRCSRCDGTGRVNKSFGKSWSKTYGYGYGDVCGACDGTGYDFD